jgi:hypothetical protein
MRQLDDLAATAFSIGHVALGCALGYLDFRFAAGDGAAIIRSSRWAQFLAPAVGPRH